MSKMFKRENLRKNFLRVKQNIDQNLGRAEQSKVLTEDQQENEKRVDLVKQAFQNISKKTGAVLQASGTDFDKRLKKLPETALSHAMTESAQALGTDTLLGSVCQLCGDCQMSLARELVQYEETVEQEFLVPLQTTLDVEIPSIIKLRKALSKSILDMDSAKTRLNQIVRQSQVPGANMTNAAAKADVIKDEYDEATLKMENIKDNLSIEMCNFAAKESEQSSRLLMLLEAQANYHRKALEVIEASIPQVVLAIKNSSAKPCYGMPLEEHLHLMCRDIALVLEACVLTLLETGMEEEGLFRLAGSAVKLKKLKACFDAHSVDMEEFSSDPHTVAGALKQYLRELPEPLLTYMLYDDFIQAAMLPQEQRLQALWTVINKLPKPNYNNFRYLIKFLAKLAEKCDMNKMKPSNIAIVIGPNLIWSEKNTTPNMQTTGTLSGIIETVVTHADWFFPGELDFHLTGYGSSPAYCREPGFAYNTNIHPSDSKPVKEKEISADWIEGSKTKELSKRSEGKEAAADERFSGVPVTILPLEESSVNLPVKFHANTSDDTNPFSENSEIKSAGKIEMKSQLELDFNVVYSGDDSLEGGQVHSEKPQSSVDTSHVQVAQGLQVTQDTAQPSSRPVSPIHLDSSDSITAGQKRAGRKPAPQPPPDRPYTVMTGTSVLGSDVTTEGCGNDGADISNSQAPRAAPLAIPETAGVQDRQKLPVGHSDRPFVPPPHRPDQPPPHRPDQPPPQRPDQALPERPKLPNSLNPPVPVRGHQRSASTGALVSQTAGSFDIITIAGVPNAGTSLSSSTEGRRQDDDAEGFRSESVDSVSVVQNVVPSSPSGFILSHQTALPQRLPPPPVARESEFTKL